MSRGQFAKIYRRLWDGTLADNPYAWSIFVFMLAHCDASGEIDMTPEAIAARSRFPLERVKEAIGVLESEDPESRREEESGRRIRRIHKNRSWGWQIVNYRHYRTMTPAERMQQYRYKHRVTLKSLESNTYLKEEEDRSKKRDVDVRGGDGALRRVTPRYGPLRKDDDSVPF